MENAIKPVTLALAIIGTIFMMADICFAESSGQFSQLTGEDTTYSAGHKIVALSPF